MVIIIDNMDDGIMIINDNMKYYNDRWLIGSR